MNLTYGSVCSGIEAASMAWESLGWKPAWFAEIEPFPSAVLKHHWPHVTNLGDMTKIPDMILNREIEAPDVFVGGTPCQAFSVAGKRESLDDDRGLLTLKYVEIVNAIDEIRRLDKKEECISIWENVPGALSTKDNAFGCFLGAMSGEVVPLEPPGGKWTNAGCVFGPQRAIAWRILDAQYFGLAQRRNRVFVVASARNGFSPEEVLFEFTGLRRDSAPSRKSGEKSPSHVREGVADANNNGSADGRRDGGVEDPYVIDRAAFNQGQNAQFNIKIAQENTMSTLVAKGPHAVGLDVDALVAYNITFCDTNGTRKDRPDGGLYVTETEVYNTLTNGGADTKICFDADVYNGAINNVTSTIGANSGMTNTAGGKILQNVEELGVAFQQNTRDEVRLIDGDGSIAGALSAEPGMKQTNYILDNLALYENHANDSRVTGPYDCSPTLTTRMGTGGGNVPLVGPKEVVCIQGSVIGREDCNGPQGSGINTDVSFTLNATDRHAISYVPDVVGTITAKMQGATGWAPYNETAHLIATPMYAKECDVCDTVTSKWHKGSGGPSGSEHGMFVYQPVAPRNMVVRRLTPNECAVLQGFPREHAQIPWKNKPADECPDGLQYKAYGNSMAVPVMGFIGKRIDEHLSAIPL